MIILKLNKLLRFAESWISLLLYTSSIKYYSIIICFSSVGIMRLAESNCLAKSIAKSNEWSERYGISHAIEYTDQTAHWPRRRYRTLHNSLVTFEAVVGQHSVYMGCAVGTQRRS